MRGYIFVFSQSPTALGHVLFRMMASASSSTYLIVYDNGTKFDVLSTKKCVNGMLIHIFLSTRHKSRTEK